MSPLKTKRHLQSESSTESEDSDVKAVFSEWETRKKALLEADDKTYLIKKSSKSKAKKRKSNSSASSESDDETTKLVYAVWEARKKILLRADKKTPNKTKQKLSASNSTKRNLNRSKRRRTKSSSASETAGTSEDDECGIETQPTVSRKSLNDAIRLLEQERPKPTTVESRLQKFCKGELSMPISFDSSTSLFIAIRRCILTRNWNRLVDLLLIFMKINTNIIHRKYVKEVSYMWILLLS